METGDIGIYPSKRRMERGTIKNQNGRSVEIVLTVDKDNTIHLTRGDTARFSLGQIVNTITNTNYTPTAEDTVTMTIKKTVMQADPFVQIIVPGGEVLHIKPEDTKAMAFGKYVYDVQITMADGDVYTIIPPTTFELLKEVT